ncbi:MAG: sugar transferase [Planctomycetales bacterium]|nr:sugar transferase [Planctomycetales bacterium]
MLAPANTASPPPKQPVERLPPVSPEDLLRDCAGQTPPAWLRQLDLSQQRTDIGCLRWRTRCVKRLLDIVVASVLLLLTAPLLLLAALAIKLSSPGPVLFTQTRVGLNTRRQRAADKAQVSLCRRRVANYGRPFTIYKLRTMHVAAAAVPHQAQQLDPRVIPIGRLLRRMRIDELPQLVNVLRGEMSMVGPRPECIEYMEELSRKVPNYLQRLGLKPGLTGIAQIESGYANDLASYRSKVGFDLIYLQNCCLGNDLRIMLRTFRVILTGFGAL